MAPQAKSTGIVSTPLTLINDFLQRHQVFAVIASIVMVFGVAVSAFKPWSIQAGRVSDHSTLEGIRALVTGEPIKPPVVTAIVPAAVQKRTNSTKPTSTVKAGSNKRAPKYTVTGAGTTGVNGDYVDMGVPDPATYPTWSSTAGTDSAHYYEKVGSPNRYLSNHGGVSGAWALGYTDPEDSSGLYWVSTDGTVNVPFGGWGVSRGSGPPPVVILSSGGSSTYTVSGAGTTTANGVYVDQGVNNGAVTGYGGGGTHWYAMVTGGNPFFVFYHADGSSWVIYDDYGVGTLYYAPDSGSMTPPLTGWNKANGADSAPTLAFKKLAPARTGAKTSLAAHKK